MHQLTLTRVSRAPRCVAQGGWPQLLRRVSRPTRTVWPLARLWRSTSHRTYNRLIKTIPVGCHCRSSADEVIGVQSWFPVDSSGPSYGLEFLTPPPNTTNIPHLINTARDFRFDSSPYRTVQPPSWSWRLKLFLDAYIPVYKMMLS